MRACELGKKNGKLSDGNHDRPLVGLVPADHAFSLLESVALAIALAHMNNYLS
jgi:hypothetical protein